MSKLSGTFFDDAFDTTDAARSRAEDRLFEEVWRAEYEEWLDWVDSKRDREWYEFIGEVRDGSLQGNQSSSGRPSKGRPF